MESNAWAHALVVPCLHESLIPCALGRHDRWKACMWRHVTLDVLAAAPMRWIALAALRSALTLESPPFALKLPAPLGESAPPSASPPASAIKVKDRIRTLSSQCRGHSYLLSSTRRPAAMVTAATAMFRQPSFEYLLPP
jgi:hypothetical protein